MQQPQPAAQDPMSVYPQHIYYQPAAFAASPAAYVPFAANANQPMQQPPPPPPQQQPQYHQHEQSASPHLQGQLLEPSSQADQFIATNNCCDICCPGCSSCFPALGSCQSCDPSCVSCCVRSPGCSPGGCCSSTGCSPTRCSGWVGVWGVVVAMQWLSFVFVLSAVCVPNWFMFTRSWWWLSVGLWTKCEVSQYDLRGSQCSGVSYRFLLDVNDLDLFQTMRAFAILSLLFTLVSAILTSIRLARHQRQQVISSRLEWLTHAAGLSSFLSLLVSFVVSIVAMNRFSLPSVYWYLDTRGQPGAGFALLCTAFALMLLAVPIHAISLLLYKRANGNNQPQQEGGDNSSKSEALLEQQLLAGAGGEGEAHIVPAAASPLPYSSSFQHPAPYFPPGQYRPPRTTGYQPAHTATGTSIKTPQW